MRVFLGHHKCASSWFSGFQSQIANRLGATFKESDRKPVGTAFSGSENRMGGENVDFLSIRNAHKKVLRENGLLDHPCIHVVRDPRDILVSAYYSHLKSHPVSGWPELIEIRNELNSLDLAQGLARELELLAPVFEDLSSFLDGEGTERILCIKYEDFCTNNYGAVIQMMNHWDLIDEHDLTAARSLQRGLIRCYNGVVERLGIGGFRYKRTNLGADEGLGIAYQMRFEKLADGRERGEVDESSHLRSGVAGGWRGVLAGDALKRLESEWKHLFEGYRYELSG